MSSFLLTLWLGLRLQLLLPPPADRRIRPSAHFWLLLALQIGSSVCIAWLYAAGTTQFEVVGVQSDALLALLTLVSASIAVALLRRPVMAWSVAVLWMAAGLWLSWFWVALDWLLIWAGLERDGYRWPVLLALLIWWLAILWRSMAGLAPATSIKRLLAALLAAALSSLPALLLPLAPYFSVPMPATIANFDSDEEQAPWPLQASPEQLFAAQHALVQASLAGLKAQDPERIDAYLLAFGGDGSESVFRNEVDYVQALFAQRFDMAGRTVGLLNSPWTTEQMPLASLSNLRETLAGLSRIMDPQQDLLILFMTSHGSEDHRLYVDLLGMPLDQINPQQLQQALIDSGITWKVAIVSACYSGGFIEALADSTSLVMTAARADRPSFGCGVDSDFTYFGRALLIEALNQTTDLLLAFDLAKERVAEREADEDLDPSDPQFASTPLIEAKLRSWQQQFEPGPTLPWNGPADPAEER